MRNTEKKGSALKHSKRPTRSASPKKAEKLTIHITPGLALLSKKLIRMFAWNEFSENEIKYAMDDCLEQLEFMATRYDNKALRKITG